MEIFRKLGEQVEDAWRENNYNEEVFPGARGRGLRRRIFRRRSRRGTCSSGRSKETELPPQKDPHGNFGDPPITLFDGAAVLHRRVFLVRGHDGHASTRVLRGVSGADGLEHPQLVRIRTAERVNVFTEIGECR